jgi:hypothetical protein
MCIKELNEINEKAKLQWIIEVTVSLRSDGERDDKLKSI